MTDPATQLEIAAQWLKEAALLIKNKDSLQFSRVAHECLDVAKKVRDDDRLRSNILY